MTHRRMQCPKTFSYSCIHLLSQALCPHLNNIQVTADSASAASSRQPLTPSDAKGLFWGSIANKYSLCDRALYLENLNLLKGQKTVSLRF